MNEQHTNIREEMFWFTAAAVAFNTLFIVKDAPVIPKWAIILASGLVSLFGIILILTRWVANAKANADAIRENEKNNANYPLQEKGRFKHLLRKTPNPEFSASVERFKYSISEIRTGVKAFPYIVAECSGSLFYFFLILITFIGVVLRSCFQTCG